LSKKIAVLLPQNPVADIENRTVDQVRLVLLAAAKLRLGEILVIEIENQALFCYVYEGKKRKGQMFTVSLLLEIKYCS